jgi:hypothetical protein
MVLAARLFILTLLAAGLSAQSLELYSEFQRVDPFGRILPADRAETPREILSPAVARGAHASFHLAITVPAGENYFLYVASNPEDACTLKLYRERFVKAGAEWIPDALEEAADSPEPGVIPDPAQNIPGQTTRLYLLDIAVPRDAKPGRFRVEAQLKVGTWIVQPLEMRVYSPQVPAAQGGGAAPSIPALSDGADKSAEELLTSYFSGKFNPAQIEPRTVRDVIARDVIQDLLLAGPYDASMPRPAAVKKLWESRGPRKQTGAEWYLKIRDYLYSTGSRP